MAVANQTQIFAFHRLFPRWTRWHRLDACFPTGFCSLLHFFPPFEPVVSFPALNTGSWLHVFRRVAPIISFPALKTGSWLHVFPRFAPVICFLRMKLAHDCMFSSALHRLYGCIFPRCAPVGSWLRLSRALQRLSLFPRLKQVHDCIFSRAFNRLVPCLPTPGTGSLFSRACVCQ